MRPPGRHRRRADAGSAVVEFVLFTIVAIVPLAWAGLALQQLAAIHQATEAAAGESLRAFLTGATEQDARRRADLAADLALADRAGVRSIDLRVSCGAARCLHPGASVRVDLSVRAELPQIPVLGLTPALTADAVQYGVVDAYVAPR
jgi:hypothetical protein